MGAKTIWTDQNGNLVKRTTNLVLIVSPLEEFYREIHDLERQNAVINVSATP